MNTPEVTELYAHADVLWLLCPLLLFWLTRLWLSARRRLIHDDPVVETLCLGGVAERHYATQRGWRTEPRRSGEGARALLPVCRLPEGRHLDRDRAEAQKKIG